MPSPVVLIQTVDSGDGTRVGAVGVHAPTKFVVAGALFGHSRLINEETTWSSQVHTG